MARQPNVLFIKPPDRFLENEFVYQQLGPHYLQSYLAAEGIASDLLVLYERPEVRRAREAGDVDRLRLEQLNMLLIRSDGSSLDAAFDHRILADYDLVGMSVMSPQAPDAYLLNEEINRSWPHLTTVIGGSHARYYLDRVRGLGPDQAFDFIVPGDGWEPMLRLASGRIKKEQKSRVLTFNSDKLTTYPAPSRPLSLMQRYNFNIAGVPAYHTITALGCPFSCFFCESGREKVRKFSESMIDEDLATMAAAHGEAGHRKKAVMFFDDVGLMNPRQVQRLSGLVSRNGYTTWRAFTHAYLVERFGGDLLQPFHETGGRRIGMGLETGSQRSLDLISKRNGQQQYVEEHYSAVRIANEAGIAVDAFTMIYPWEDEEDLQRTTEMIEFIVQNPVRGVDEQNRPLRNHVDSTIMTPYQGTQFFDMIGAGDLPGVTMRKDLDPGTLYYKGNQGGSGWPYQQTRLPRQRYEEVQSYRNSLRPDYR